MTVYRKIPTFQNGDRLLDIRLKSLNPTIDELNKMGPKLETAIQKSNTAHEKTLKMQPDVKRSIIKGVAKSTITKTGIDFYTNESPDSNPVHVDLTPIYNGLKTSIDELNQKNIECNLSIQQLKSNDNLQSDNIKNLQTEKLSKINLIDGDGGGIYSAKTIKFSNSTIKMAGDLATVNIKSQNIHNPVIPVNKNGISYDLKEINIDSNSDININTDGKLTITNTNNPVNIIAMFNQPYTYHNFENLKFGENLIPKILFDNTYSTDVVIKQLTESNKTLQVSSLEINKNGNYDIDVIFQITFLNTIPENIIGKSFNAKLCIFKTSEIVVKNFNFKFDESVNHFPCLKLNAKNVSLKVGDSVGVILADTLFNVNNLSKYNPHINKFKSSISIHTSGCNTSTHITNTLRELLEDSSVVRGCISQPISLIDNSHNIKFTENIYVKEIKNMQQINVTTIND